MPGAHRSDIQPDLDTAAAVNSKSGTRARAAVVDTEDHIGRAAMRVGSGAPNG